MRRIGLCFTGQPYRISEMVAAAQWAEANGFDSLWVAEDSWTGHDAITALSCIAYGTTRIRIGTSLIGIATRNPVLSALTLNGLWELAPNRLVLGLGLAQGWHLPGSNEAATPTSPLKAMRAAVETVRALASGREIPWGAGRRGMMIPRPWFVGAVPPIDGHLPVYLGAVRPRMTQLAGEIGDGLLLEMEAMRQDLPGRLEQFNGGARKAGRDPENLDIVKLILASPTGRGGTIHPNALGWATKSVSLLDSQAVNRLGWDSGRVARIRGAWADQDWERGKALMTAEMVRSFVAAGPPERCLEVIEETVGLGAKLPVLIPYGGDMRPVLELGAAFAAGRSN